MEPQAPPVAATAARRIALQMLEERGRGAVLMGVARVDAALEHLLQAAQCLRPLRRISLPHGSSPQLPPGGGVRGGSRQSPQGTPGNRSRCPARFPPQPPGASPARLHFADHRLVPTWVVFGQAADP